MEFIFELILEIFFECIGALISEIVSDTVHFIDARSKLKKAIKYIVTYSILTLSIILIVLSLIYNKKLFVVIAVSYLCIIVLLNLLNTLNRDVFKKKFIFVFSEIIKRIAHYSYPIILMVCASNYLVDKKARVSVIIISIIAIFVWFSIDMYKVWKFSLRKAENNKYKHLTYHNDYMNEYDSYKLPENINKLFKGKSIYKQLNYLRVTSDYSTSLLTSLRGLNDNSKILTRVEEHSRVEGIIIRRGKVIGLKIRTYAGLENCMIGESVKVNVTYVDNNGAFMKKEEFLYLVAFDEEIDDGRKE